MGNNILVVDDEKILCTGIKRLLESKGYKVDCALNGAEALDLVVENIYALILVDLVLPDINGGELCKKILEINLNTKIIMMSGHYGLLEELEARNKLRNVFIRFIRKPFENENLIKCVNIAVDK